MTIEALSGDRLSDVSERPFTEREGEHECVQLYKIPDDRLVAAQQHLVTGRENILPGHDKEDIYAPCVSSVQVVPSQEFPKHHVATVLFRRPSPRVILQPGRAMLSIETYSTTIKREYGQLNKREAPTAGVVVVQVGPLFEVKVGLEVWERVALVIRAADWATQWNTVSDRAQEWRAKGGKLTIYGKLWENLKCSRVQIQHRGTDASILDSSWTFVQNDDGWPIEGIIEETWIGYDSNGNELILDPATHRPVNQPMENGLPVSWVTRRLTVQTSDVISGEADFSALEDYFKWMTTGG